MTPHGRYVLRLADTNLVLAQRLGEWVGHAPALEEDLGLANVVARPARPGAAPARACRAARGPRPRRGRARVPARGIGVLQPDARRAAERRLRRHHRAPVPVRCLAARPVRGTPRLERRDARRGRGQGPRRGRVSPALQRRMARPARRRHGREPRARRGRRSRGCGRTPQELFDDDDVDRAAAEAGIGVLPSTLEGAFAARVDETLARATLARPGEDRVPAGTASRAATASISATCWPRCSPCTAPIPARRGSGRGRAGTCRDGAAAGGAGAAARHPGAGRGPGDPGALGARPRRDPASRRSAPDGRLEVGISPTYSGCPANAVIKADVLRALRARGLRCRRRRRAGAALVQRLAERGGAPQAREPTASPRRARRRTRGRLPALRFGAHVAHQRVRLDALQGALPMRGLPRAVRLLQVHLALRC